MDNLENQSSGNITSASSPVSSNYQVMPNDPHFPLTITIENHPPSNGSQRRSSAYIGEIPGIQENTPKNKNSSSIQTSTSTLARRSSIEEDSILELPLIGRSRRTDLTISRSHKRDRQPNICYRYIPTSSQESGIELMPVGVQEQDKVINLIRISKDSTQIVRRRRKEPAFYLKKMMYYSVHIIFHIFYIIVTADMYFNVLKLSISAHVVVIFAFFVSLSHLKEDIKYNRTRRRKRKDILISRCFLLIYYLIMLLPLFFLGYIDLLFEKYDKILLLTGKLAKESINTTMIRKV